MPPRPRAPGPALDALDARLLGARALAAGEPDAAKAALQVVAADAGRLTEREHEIATLVGQGRSNQQVAASLYLSEKTVANALTRVYAKLGIRSRTQLAAML